MVWVNTLGLAEGANGCVVPGRATDMNKEFFALDARTGKTLYAFNTGSSQTCRFGAGSCSGIPILSG
jgi:hypothetical protein